MRTWLWVIGMVGLTAGCHSGGKTADTVPATDQYMRFILLCLIGFSLQACYYGDDGPPHIRYRKGDVWVSNFRNNNFPSKTFADDKIYCSGLEPGGSDSSELLYCLDLKTGMVNWTAEVGRFATFPPIVGDSFIYFCSYVGDIYKFDKQGHKIWEQESPSAYSGHCLNPLNNNLIVHTVTNGSYELAFKDGAIVNHFAKRSLGSTLPVFYGRYMIQADISKDTTVIGAGTWMRCMDYTAKKDIWEYDMGADIDNLFVNNGKLYFVTKDHVMHCIDVITGTALWQSDRLSNVGGPLSSAFVYDRGHIICFGFNLDDLSVLDDATGKILANGSYPEVRRMQLMAPQNHTYLTGAGGRKYTIRVSDSLITTHLGYNVEVIEH